MTLATMTRMAALRREARGSMTVAALTRMAAPFAGRPAAA